MSDFTNEGDISTSTPAVMGKGEKESSRLEHGQQQVGDKDKFSQASDILESAESSQDSAAASDDVYSIGKLRMNLQHIVHCLKNLRKLVFYAVWIMILILSLKIVLFPNFSNTVLRSGATNNTPVVSGRTALNDLLQLQAYIRPLLSEQITTPSTIVLGNVSAI